MRVGARHADRAGLERLAQRVEHRALELQHCGAEGTNWGLPNLLV